MEMNRSNCWNAFWGLALALAEMSIKQDASVRSSHWILLVTVTKPTSALTYKRLMNYFVTNAKHDNSEKRLKMKEKNSKETLFGKNEAKNIKTFSELLFLRWFGNLLKFFDFVFLEEKQLNRFFGSMLSLSKCTVCRMAEDWYRCRMRFTFYTHFAYWEKTKRA